MLCKKALSVSIIVIYCVLRRMLYILTMKLRLITPLVCKQPSTCDKINFHNLLLLSFFKY